MLVARITFARFSVSSAISLPQVGGRAWKHGSKTGIGKACLQLRIGEACVDFLVQLVDDSGRRVPGRAKAVPGACLVTRYELTHGRGRSGSISERVAVVIASARSLLLICAIDVGTEANITCTSPPSKSFSAGAEPR